MKATTKKTLFLTGLSDIVMLIPEDPNELRLKEVLGIRRRLWMSLVWCMLNQWRHFQ